MNNHVLAIMWPTGVTFGYIISPFIMSHVKRKHHFTFSAAIMGISEAILGFALKADVICFVNLMLYNFNKDYIFFIGIWT